MGNFINCFKRPIENEKGMSDLLVILIILPTFLGITFMVLTFFTFNMRQAKLDDIKDRALQMVQTDGYLTQTIMQDTRDKLAAIGYPTVTKDGVTYPSFAGSTLTKVLKDDPDPTVKLVIEYPASEMAKLLVFFGVSSTEEPGYYHLEGYGRSEKYD